MKVHKYYIRPADEASATIALEEISLYVQARNRLLRLREKWQRIRDEMILPEYRTKAAELRATPRTGRKPTKVRSDRDELRAADTRALYAEFIAAGGSYATWWLAEAAASSKKVKHPIRDEHAGRAGMLPERLRWDGSTMHYGQTAWTVHHGQLAQRPIPDDARVAQVWVQRERTSTNLLRSPRYSWFLVVVLDAPAAEYVSDLQRTAAGLDIAWRQDQDTLRVAYVADDTGEHRPIRMRAQSYARLQHAASIAALADSDANVLRKEYGVPANTSHRRLIELAPPDHERAVHLVHLAEWHHGARRNAIAARDEHYLQEVHALCAAHHTIFVEKMKATPKLVQKAGTRRKRTGIEDAEGGVAREQRQIAAPFTFLRLLEAEAPKFGTTIIKIPPAYTSRICFACNNDMGAGSQLERRCAECGTSWDVDFLAALNLLKWGLSRGAEPGDSGEALATE